jgi:hypothetical protein
LLHENTFDNTRLAPNADIVYTTVAWLLESLGIFSLHASFAAYQDIHYLLPGTGAVGKTTTALNMALNGGRIYADDRVFVSLHKEGRPSIWPFPKKIAVTEETVNLFKALDPVRQLPRKEKGKIHFEAPAHIAGDHRSPVFADIILFPEIDKTGKAAPASRALTKIEAFTRLINSEVLYPPSEKKLRSDQLDMAVALTNGSPCFQTRFGPDMRANLDHIARLGASTSIPNLS